MSESEDSVIPGLEPFSFQGWDDPTAVTNPPLDFADKRRRECDRMLHLLIHSDRKHAEKFMVQGRWWHCLPYLSKEEAIDLQLSKDARREG